MRRESPAHLPGTGNCGNPVTKHHCLLLNSSPSVVKKQGQVNVPDDAIPVHDMVGVAHSPRAGEPADSVDVRVGDRNGPNRDVEAGAERAPNPSHQDRRPLGRNREVNRVRIYEDQRAQVGNVCRSPGMDDSLRETAPGARRCTLVFQLPFFGAVVAEI
jgi:hypothetical protein